MYQISCAKAGHDGCHATIRAGSEEELRAKMTEHARKKHNVQTMTDTIYQFLRVRGGNEQSRMGTPQS
jgi:predicted small metal-binding protein